MGLRSIALINHDLTPGHIEDLLERRQGNVARTLALHCKLSKTGEVTEGFEIIEVRAHDAPALFYFDGGSLRNIESLTLEQLGKVQWLLNQEAASKVV